MTDEEILLKKLDRLNQNSHYGIMIDTEITKIVRSHIKRLEETKMKNDIYPLVVVLDRYNGTYSGGKWTAWNLNYVPSKIDADDTECADFFAKNMIVYGRGETPQEAIDDLKMILDCGISDPDEEDEDEEDNKMKATSVQNIKNVKDICFSVENDPIERESKLTIVASTNDDIFEFEFEGSNLLQSCKKVGLFTGLEKDQKIRELEKENKQNKESADIWSREYYNLSKKFDKLKEENEKLKHDDMLDKEAADYWSKEHDILLKRFKKLQVENEGSSDNVNHPNHYTGKYECIDVMQDVFGDEATNNFCLCNAFKYIWRARKKNGLEDVKKAVWYLNKYVEEAEKDGQDKSIAGT